MTREYRNTRAKVTTAIYEVLYGLVESEKDFEKKKKHPAKWYRVQVAEELKLRDNENPSLRSYEDKLAEIRHYMQAANPLDEPWTIGTCLKYNIALSEAWLRGYRVTKDTLARPTIREARWFALLYASLEPRIKAKCPELKPMEQLGRIVLIAEQYARREQIAEANNDILNTLDLDERYFVKEDFSSMSLTVGFLGGWFQKTKQRTKGR